MKVHELEQLVKQPAVRLLRSPQAPIILGFFHRTFKLKPRTTVQEGEMRALLQVFLTEHSSQMAEDSSGRAADLLADWRNDDHGFLRRYYVEGSDEPVFELTSGAEKALLWMEALKAVDFIGTESRLSEVFDGLELLLRHASGDVDERIRLLEAEKQRIEAELERVRTTGTVEQYSPVKINERLSRLVNTARELLGDFRAVEESFQRIAQEIAERQTQQGVTKGHVVGRMLDAHDNLAESYQGQSYYAFRELLLSAERQQRFEDSVSRLRRLSQADPSLRDDPALGQFLVRLLLEDDKVMASNQRVSTNLRRALATTDLAERRAMQETFREIRALAVTLRERMPDDAESFFELLLPERAFEAMSRPFKADSETPTMTIADEAEADGTLGEAFRRLANFPLLRLAELEQQLEKCLESQATITLPEVLRIYPPRHGMIEVLGYLILAARGEGRHFIDIELARQIDLPEADGSIKSRWQLPAVLFCRK